MSNKKYHSLSLEEKVKIIEMKENNIAVKAICEAYKCGKTQVYDAVKKRAEIYEEWLKGDVNRKRKRVIENRDIDELTWEWFVNARADNMSVSGILLQEKAKEIAKKLNKTDFKASNGWLLSFKNRHGITKKQLKNKLDNVDIDVLEWSKKLPVLLCGYKPQDIYNCGESGLFFRDLPSKNLIEKCDSSEKHTKERLTIFLCCNTDGFMEKPLIISAKPSCFKNVCFSNLPVVWKFDKNACMTSAILQEWLRSFNSQMKCQNRTVLLFLDHGVCHPNTEYSNVKLIFLPRNRTAEIQPLGQGIFFAVKMNYRLFLLQSLLSSVNSTNSLLEVAKAVTVFDAMKWLIKACEKISRGTIKKCFSKARFPLDGNAEDDIVEYSFQEFDALMCEVNNFLGFCEIDSMDYIKADDNLNTSGCVDIVQDLLQDSKCQPEEGESSNEENDNVDEEEDETVISSYTQAVQAIKHLQTFFTKRGDNDLLSMCIDLQLATEKEVVFHKRLK